jgi:transcriptional regulator with XRE-family HTH domain
MEIARQLGHRIRELRAALSLTQEQLAERAKISVSFLSMMERGERLPHIKTLVVVSDALGISLSQMFAGMNEPDSNHRQALLPLMAHLENVNLDSADVAALLLIAKAMFRDRT